MVGVGSFDGWSGVGSLWWVEWGWLTVVGGVGVGRVGVGKVGMSSVQWLSTESLMTQLLK